MDVEAEDDAVREMEALRERVLDLERELAAVRRREAQAAAEHRSAALILKRTNRRLRKQMAESEKARRRAEALALEKTSFLANMSHEIRTPMTAIIGFAELLQDAQHRRRAAAGDEDATCEQENRRHVDMIRTCGAQLLNLINDILDMSKIERRGISLQQAPVFLPDIVAEVCAVMRPTAHEKRIALEPHYRTAVPKELHTDRTVLTRILMNLVCNALKFTEQGSVSVDVAFVRNGGEGCVDISVTDTGIGIAPEHVDRLFRPFYQIEACASKVPGSGLGLAISRELVRLLGGEIEVRSEPGQGSTFHFWVPCSGSDASVLVLPDESGPTPQPSEGNMPLTGGELPYNILVAEDVETNRMLIERILKKAGAAVTLAKNGGAAVAAAMEAAQAGSPYDAILMDMVMPVLSGYEAVRILRSSGYRLPILALTANAMGSDKARCLQVGCDGYLSKPINRRELVTVIRRYVEPREGCREEFGAQA